MPTDWKTHQERYLQSGLNFLQYCAQENLKPQSARRYLRKKDQVAQVAQTDCAEFAQSLRSAQTSAQSSAQDTVDSSRNPNFLTEELTEKQKLFVFEYLVDLNATQAAIRAGYSENSASVIGFDLLKQNLVSQAISKALWERAQELKVESKDVVRVLADLAFGELTDVVRWSNNFLQPLLPEQLSRRGRTLLKKIKLKPVLSNQGEVHYEMDVDLWDKMKALELLARHLGMLNDKFKVDTGVQQNLEELLELTKLPRLPDTYEGWGKPEELRMKN